MLRFTKLGTLLVLSWIAAAQQENASWQGVLLDELGHAIPAATIILEAAHQQWTAATAADGGFHFVSLDAGGYAVSVRLGDRLVRAPTVLEIQAAARIETTLRLTAAGELLLRPTAETKEAGSTGGERLSSKNVAGLPLNKRDFSQLLLLASGTQTDTNGAANFTQQFAVNGQRGTTAVFAMDGINTTDPELGGTTFSNFNVDAIQEIRASSGVMPAEIGHGAASFTDIITQSGSNRVHGVVFEFLRNAAFDARNFFDRRSIADPR